jgi:hypothetical protein
MVNVRTKGSTGEREVAAMLNEVCMRLEADGVKIDYNPDFPKFQRNQNQSAVGGSDLTNPYKMGIEVKRQENLSINTWWKQCLEASVMTKELPILIYKQNRKKWKVLMYVDIPIEIKGCYKCCRTRAEFDVDSFKNWAYNYIKTYVELEG